MVRTIRQAAEEIGVSKQAIQQHLTKEFRQAYIDKQGNKLLINDKGFLQLKKLLNRKSDQKSTNKKRQANRQVNDKQDTDYLPVYLVEKELDAKNKQIESLQRLLDQQQKLTLDLQNKLDVAQKQLAAPESGEEQKSVVEKPKKKHWWQRK